MSNILVAVDEQNLHIIEAPKIAAQGVKENYIICSFDSSWSGFGKTALFYRAENEGKLDQVYESPIDGDGYALIPHEVTDKDGKICFCVVGVKDDIVYTTEILKYKIVKGLYTAGQETKPPTPGFYEQILTIAGQMDGLYNSLKFELKADIENEETARKAADIAEASTRASADLRLTNEISVERSRIDQLSQLPSGSTSGDAELMDIRVGADGKTYGSAGTSVRSQINNIRADMSDFSYEMLLSINLFDGEFDESGYFNASGNQPSSNFKRTSKYYPIVGENNGKLYAYLSAITPAFSIGFYDANKEWLGVKNVNNAQKKENEIPAGSSFFRVYTNYTFGGNVTIALSYVNSYVPYISKFFLKDKTVSENNLDDALRAKINSDLKLTGKKIAFMGDSIIGNFYDSTGVCAILAEKTGATVINCAFGGTRLAYEYSQYGDTTPGATGYIYGATDAEKNQVDQYRYWNTLSGYGLSQAIISENWTAQDNAVANMRSGLSYFADRLAEIKAVDWSTVDFIMWEYGTNDFMTKVKLSDTSDLTNMYAYDNAYRHIIESILTAYPYIRIIPVTPIYRWYQSGGVYTEDSNTHTQKDYTGVSSKLTDFVAMAQAVAKEYQLPCIDDYYTLGANRFTRLTYFDSTDGTHPNANGRKRIAEHIAAQLITFV